MTPKNEYLKLLEHIDSHGIIKPFNVSPFMNEFFQKPGPPKGISDGWNLEQEREATRFLGAMKEKGWIDYDPKLLSEKIHGYRPEFINDSGEDSSLQWFDSVDFYINFTSSGYEYLNQHKISKSILETNKASRRSFITTFCLSVVIAISSIIGLLKNCCSKNTSRSDVKEEQQ